MSVTYLPGSLLNRSGKEILMKVQNKRLCLFFDLVWPMKQTEITYLF